MVKTENMRERGIMMKNVLIVGAGKGGSAILTILRETDTMNVKAVVDVDPNAPGLKLAADWKIPVGTDWRDFLTSDIDVIVEATGDEDVFESIRETRGKNTVLIPGTVAHIISNLMEEKEQLINQLQTQFYTQDLILNSTHDGMIAIDKEGRIILFNKRAEELTSIKGLQVMGQFIEDIYPTSGLTHVLKSRRKEINQEQILANGKKIITTRIPMINEHNELIGAFEVFKDVTEIVDLANELTNVKEIQTMLEAIIQSSEEAISVVDEEGNGIMINPAYTRITGLTKEEVIGKPATADISEGESMHLRVLKTKKPVRGVKLRVGPNRREVLVNVAPVIVDGKLKGSVGVIHDVSEIKSLTDELQRARQIIRTLEAKYSFDDIIGTSDEMKLSLEQAQLAAKTPATVLLRGESGTGKELFAHAIHNGSDRKYNKFVRVNCAALSETLLESELFGYEEGAFSGAKRGGKRGLFEEANNGSIFLDEIGELTPNTQAKLLRVLQENEIVRVGGTKAIPINVRVIAATNVNLEKAIKEGKFREDLYYRLNRLPIHIPPLRERKSDLLPLCQRLIQKINQDYGRNVEGITKEAIDYLREYDWPGNVRELENILGRAMIYMHFHETRIDIAHLQAFNLKVSDSDQDKEPSERMTMNHSLSKMVEEYEKNVITHMLKKHQGNKTATARALGISLRNFYYKLEKYQIANSGMQ